MTHRMLSFCCALGALTLLLVVWAPAAAAEGQEVFLGQKCNLCHSVESADIAAKTKSEKLFGGDLSDVMTRQEEAWVAQYIQRQVQKEGEDHKREFTGSDEELQALIDWLKEQATASAGGEG